MIRKHYVDPFEFYRSSGPDVINSRLDKVCNVVNRLIIDSDLTFLSARSEDSEVVETIPIIQCPYNKFNKHLHDDDNILSISNSSIKSAIMVTLREVLNCYGNHHRDDIDNVMMYTLDECKPSFKIVPSEDNLTVCIVFDMPPPIALSGSIDGIAVATAEFDIGEGLIREDLLAPSRKKHRHVMDDEEDPNEKTSYS